MAVKIDKPRTPKEGLEQFVFSGAPSVSLADKVKKQEQALSVFYTMSSGETSATYDDAEIRAYIDTLHNYQQSLINRNWRHITYALEEIKRLWAYVHNLEIPEGGTQVRTAYLAADAGDALTASCYLDADGVGSTVTVYFWTTGGGNLEDAASPLQDGDRIFVVFNQLDDQWQCITPIQTLGPVKAYVNGTPGANTYFSAYLYEDAEGTPVNVYPKIFGGGNVEDAFPVLADGDLQYVIYDEVNDQWNMVGWLVAKTTLVDNDTIKFDGSDNIYVTFDTGA